MVEHINPQGMHHNPAFTQAILIPAGARTLLIGGQNAVDVDGQIVGKGDLGAQTAKASISTRKSGLARPWTRRPVTVGGLGRLPQMAIQAPKPGRKSMSPAR